MATEVTRVVIGDYRYTLYDDRTAAARVTDTTKTSYGALQASVTHQGVTYALTSLSYCFNGCTSLTTAPEIFDGVTNMTECFSGCTALTTAPTIPSGVTDIKGCFIDCTALTTAPTIPSGVTSMYACFYGCTSLTGTIDVHGTPTYYGWCFRDTTQPITLEVSLASELPTWRAIAQTGNNGNVTAILRSNNPAPTATITAVRVASSSSTTPAETGQYAYVTVRTTASTERAPDNVAQAPTITLDGATYTPSDPSGTATFTCHVTLGDDLGHVIGATPRDTYKTGTPVTVTLASTYSPMEFHATPVYDAHGTLMGYIGGDGASFGKHATRAGVLDVAWDIESEGDISADGALSCADGSPYCSDGTNVNVGGVTVGSADNLSYVASEDTLRAPTSYTATRTSKTTGGSARYTVYGKQVVANISLNCNAISRHDVVATGFPIPSAAGADGIVAATNNRVIPVYIDASGQLTMGNANTAGWYAGQIVYFVD